MGIDVLFYDVMTNILQLLFFSLCGVLLRYLNIFEKVGEFKSAEANLHCFIPIYLIITFSKAIEVPTSKGLGLLFFSFIISSGLSAIFGWVYTKLFKVDVRVSQVFVLLMTWGNVAFLPHVLIGAMCGEGGALQGDPNCSKNTGYSFYGLFLFNLSLLILGPLYMHKDKAICYNVRRQMKLVKNFYDTPQAFLDDKDLVKMNEGIKYKKIGIESSPEKLAASPSHTETKPIKDAVQETEARINISGNAKEIFYGKNSKVPITAIEDNDLIEYSLLIHMDSNTYEQWLAHFDKFLEKLDDHTFHEIYDGQIPNPEHSPGYDMDLLHHCVTSKAIWGCIIGLIFGRIPAVMDWIYAEKQEKYFMGTFEHLSQIAIPLAVLIWGTQLYSGFTFKYSNIRLLDLIALHIMRLLIIPSIGLGFIYGLSQDGISELDNDRVLMFSMYADWLVQPGLLLLTLFVLCGYYAKEGALMMFWTTISMIVVAPLFTAAYLHMMGIPV